MSDLTLLKSNPIKIEVGDTIIHQIPDKLISPNIFNTIAINELMDSDLLSIQRNKVDTETRKIMAGYLTMSIKYYYEKYIVKHFIYSLIDITNAKVLTILDKDALYIDILSGAKITALDMYSKSNTKITLLDSDYIQIVQDQLTMLSKIKIMK